MLKLNNVRDALCNEYDIGIQRRDGEYRVFPLRTPSYADEEAVAYYTNDLEDAYISGMMMSRSYYAMMAA